jgi:putative hydrolase of HD superfamily
MMLVHDLVEIDAGDTLLYADDAQQAAKKIRELAAAERIFALLPMPQSAELRALWEEFENRATPDAKFAAAIDRLQPLLLNFMSEGAAWQRHGVTSQQVLEKNQHISAGSPALWDFAKELIQTALERGYLKPAV